MVGDERLGAFVYLNDGQGGFNSGLQLGEKGLVPYAIAIGDLNRDSKADVVIGYVTAPGSVFFNDGTGRELRASTLWGWARDGVWTCSRRSERGWLSGHCRRSKQRA